NLIALRNDILSKGRDEQGLIYDTSLTEDDDTYGTQGTYTVTLPEPAVKPFYTDMVKYYNEQVANWEYQMARNEKAKVTAITERRHWLEANQSFDSGTFIDSEVSTEFTAGHSTSNTFNTSLIVGGGTSVSIFGQDVDISLQSTTTAGSQWEESTEATRTTTTGYSLVETGDDDALSVDVYRAPDGMGAIFVTRGGQTTCPYEGEQKTKYYEPGKHILATATQQIEKPRIMVENGANRLVGVPAGKMANFPLLLTNESETGEDCYFVLFVIDDTNKKGAGIDINSNEISSGRKVLVPAGGTVRMNLELEQNNAGDLLYENIAVVLASECQSDPASTWDVIGDTVYISAEFVPSSTDVALRIDNTVVNTSTKGMLPLTVTGYDPNYDGLKYIAVQYQGVGESTWHDARKYVMNEQAILNAQIEEVLPTNGIINLNFDMTNGAVFPDRTYKFRAISARTYDKGEVTNVSQEIQVVKDMSRPKPLGQPQPTDGILSAGDELSILFNESILNGELTKDMNFRITGVLNGSEVAHQTALALQNTTQTAATEANINLAGKDFSIDTWMNVNGAGTILSHG
ncbi:MAG: LamG-like jellyroll fold domain-containing protein, partial [Prevotella sp.]